MDAALGRIPDGEFTTIEFVREFQALFPNEWKGLEQRYGQGGRHGGRNYSALTYIGKRLNGYSRRGVIETLGLFPAPAGWRNERIVKWRKG